MFPTIDGDQPPHFSGKIASLFNDQQVSDQLDTSKNVEVREVQPVRQVPSSGISSGFSSTAVVDSSLTTKRDSDISVAVDINVSDLDVKIVAVSAHQNGDTSSAGVSNQVWRLVLI